MRKRKPQFDDQPLDDADEEGACPIPDENGDVVLKGKRLNKRKKPKRAKVRRKKC